RVSGVPASSPCAVGRTSCPGGPTGNTVCTQQVGPSTEVCNGVDDNCNGQTDEGIARTTCSNPTRLVDQYGLGVALCNGGAPQQGVLLCDRGGAVCTAFEGYHFCNTCGLRNMRNPTSLDPSVTVTTNCGGCGGAACLTGNPNSCAPSQICTATYIGSMTNSCQPNTMCPAAPGKCYPVNPSGNYGPTCL
ncbi:MAG: MopE-related protein, partial [Deltaproteobacteria bacterium]|nr:MopE-related protein [Deltaproteobacteria bacterium]